MSLYHCSLAWLEPGSIIRPGNYGRVLRLFGPPHKNWVREQFLEFVREQEFPDKPSRLTSAFACENLAAAQFFKEHSCQTGLLDEVEVTDLKAKIHIADFNCVEPIKGRIEEMHEVARHYWGGSYWFEFENRPGLRCAETLVDCGLQVLAEVA